MTSEEHAQRIFREAPDGGGGTDLQVTSISLISNRWAERQKQEEEDRAGIGCGFLG